jgi:hypothetical protein
MIIFASASVSPNNKKPKTQKTKKSQNYPKHRQYPSPSHDSTTNLTARPPRIHCHHPLLHDHPRLRVREPKQRRQALPKLRPCHKAIPGPVIVAKQRLDDDPALPHDRAQPLHHEHKGLLFSRCQFVKGRTGTCDSRVLACGWVPRGLGLLGAGVLNRFADSENHI